MHRATPPLPQYAFMAWSSVNITGIVEFIFSFVYCGSLFVYFHASNSELAVIASIV
jgi:hypothetical protein